MIAGHFMFEHSRGIVIEFRYNCGRGRQQTSARGVVVLVNCDSLIGSNMMRRVIAQGMFVGWMVGWLDGMEVQQIQGTAVVVQTYPIGI